MRNYRPKGRDEIARNMAAIRSIDNKTERTLRKVVHARGLRYRKYKSGLHGKPDLVFPREMIAVFVDGDYWHGRRLIEEGLGALKKHFTQEQQPYWLAKLQRNVARDRAVTAALKSEGWLVLRFWESDVKKNVERYAGRVESAVTRRRVVLARRAARAVRPRDRHG